MPRARTEALSAPSKESKPVAMRGQAGDYQKRKGHPVSGTRETWLAPHVHLATILPPHAPRATPHTPPAGSGRARTPPRLLPDTDSRIGKDQTGPDLDKRPLYMQYVTESGDSCGQNQLFSSRSSPSDRRPFSLGWNRSTPVAPGVPAGWP